VLSYGSRGKHEWYQLMGLAFNFISTNFSIFCKNPSPLNFKKCFERFKFFERGGA